MAAPKVVWNAGVFVDAPLYAADTTTSIYVEDAKTSSAATIYTNRTGSAKSNPFNIAESGKIEFYADPGRYNITATRGADTVVWDDELIKPESIQTEEVTASFQIDSADLNKMFVVTGAGNVNITVPAEATDTLDQDFIFHVRHDGTGTVTIVEDTGVTVKPPNSGSLSVPVDGTVSCEYPRTTLNRWILYGQTISS